MNRGTFVKLLTVSGVAMYWPGAACHPKPNPLSKMLSQPAALQHICDAKTLRDIGTAYQKQVAGENSTNRLTERLANDINIRQGTEHPDGAWVASEMAKKIQLDFQQNRTVVVDGWILSLTEARQCALFSLIEK